MSQNFDCLFKEFEKKAIQANEINNDLQTILKSMNVLLVKDKEDNVKLETMMKKYMTSTIESDIIDFNVGGTLFSILKSDITKKIPRPDSRGNEFYDPNLLQGLISGIIDVKYDKNKAIFINRDPKYFHYILNYLRTANTNETFIFPKNSEDFERLLNEAEYYQVEGLTDVSGLIDSLILDKNQYQNLIRLCEFSPKDKWNLVYRGSLHGFGVANFHSKCDGIANTLTVVKSTQSYIFGAFVNVAWDSSNTWKLDHNAFLFSLVNKDNKQVKIKFDTAQTANSIYCGSGYGPTFGAGHDLHIANNANANTTSYSNLGNSYKHPQYANGSNEAKTLFAGSYNFQISEIEVFKKS